MANYTPSNWVTAQARLINRFETEEKRFRRPVTFLEFTKNPEVMIPSHKQLRTREDRAIEAYYKLRTARALGTGGRTFNHTGTHGDSGTLTPTWVAYDDTFAISIKQADNNIYTFQEMLDNEIDNVIGNFAEGLETAAASHLFTNRSGVNAMTVEGTFNAGTDAFEITDTTHGERSIQITKSMMDINKYSGQMTIFCDTIAFNKFEFQAFQGSANSTNLSFQFMGLNFVHSPDLNALAAAVPYVKGFWIAVPDGTIAALDWIPKQNREGLDTKEQTYTSLVNPVDSLQYAWHIYSTRADATATNGFEQDELIEHEISVDVALENAPLSVATESTLLAVALV